MQQDFGSSSVGLDCERGLWGDRGIGGERGRVGGGDMTAGGCTWCDDHELLGGGY